MIGLIYHAFDTSNGKSYVGQTWDTLENRRKEHLRKRKKQFVFQNALQKRQRDFVWSVLSNGMQTQKELDEAEVYWGKFFDSLHPNGYNLKLGAGRGSVSEETRKKMSAKMKGRKFSQEHVASNSAARKGLKRSPETRKKMSESHKGHVFSEEHKKKIAESVRKSKIIKN